MPDMVKTIGGISKWNETVDHVHVAPTVFAQAVDNKQHSLYITLRQPGLIIDINITHTFEITFYMFHNTSLTPDIGLTKKKGEACARHHRWFSRHCFAPTCGIMIFKQYSFWTAP
jgi:hypothetical protein